MNTRKLRVVLVGDSDVGKTTLSYTLKFNQCPDSMDRHSTIGAEYSVTTLNLNDINHSNDKQFENNFITLEIWDTAGQERYRALVPLYFRHADVYILVFDVSDRKSFESVEHWVEKIDEFIYSKNYNRSKPIILIANKIDVRPSYDDYNNNGNKFIYNDEVEFLANMFKLKTVYLSAKTGLGIEKLKQLIIQYGLQMNYKNSKNNTNNHYDSIDLQKSSKNCIYC